MAKRTWTIDSRDYGTDDEFRAAVVNELAAFENIGHRIGLALISSPIRERVGSSFTTVGWAFRTETVPAARETAQVVPLPGPPLIPLEPEPAEEPAETAEGASF